jgi:Ricin-type beta-trefoil lectin domain
VTIRHRLAAIASVIAIMALGLVGAGAASASSNSGGITYFCNSPNGDPPCIYSYGHLQPVGLKFSGNFTEFTIYYSKTIDGHKYSEYEQDGTKNCLEYTSVSGDYTNIVRMDTCTGGRASQLWWWHGYHLILYYSGNCLTSQTPLVFVYPCTTGGNQNWSG